MDVLGIVLTILLLILLLSGDPTGLELLRSWLVHVLSHPPC